MKSSTIKKIIFLSAIVFLSACTKETKKEKLNPLLADAQNIISTRPQNTKQFIVILKLKTPALLEAPVIDKGRAVVDQNLLKEILKEQEAAIKSLHELSSDIQVIFRYKMVLNGLAVVMPVELAEKVGKIGLIDSYSEAGLFAPPETINETRVATVKSVDDFSQRNSVKFIGAEKLNQAGITGRGISVGIIDTGIDYTHAMFKGLGTEEAYKAIKPSEVAVGFPNEKVVGGIDLVGTDFNPGSEDFDKNVPKPDMNPIDEAGHGSHVAGSAAGIGDGVQSYSGVAPDASLHAIKVFGAEGGTSDVAVIAGLEYAADPNNDGDAKDSLDVVNLSLGSGYGAPHILYVEAIKNLVTGGTVVVATAGNSGPKDYIVGMPGASDDALSVAASVDNTDHNWKFDTSKIHIGGEDLIVESIEAATSKKIVEAGNVTGRLVYVGNAVADFTDAQKALIKGHVALIDRGGNDFNVKIKKAVEAGAIGVVIANNQPGSAIAMGTKDKFDIPAIMINLENGTKVKAALEKAIEVTIEFQGAEKIEKVELIDTLTDFSSKGPRSFDGFIKPEISAPGSQIVSAAVGGGAKTVQMSGTSMAAPHMTGVMALMKQAQPALSVLELKSIVMGTAKTISNAQGARYPVTQQGSGRVQADKAAYSPLVISEYSLSIGETAVESKKSLRRTLHIKNISKEDLQLNPVFEGNGFITMSADKQINIKAGEKAELNVVLTLDATLMKEESIREMDGWVKLMKGGDEVYRVPVLAIAHKLSALKASDLIVHSTSKLDANGAMAELNLKSLNANKGEILLFNLIAKDERKPGVGPYNSTECDIESAGYKIINKKNEKNVDEEILQIAVKTYKPMTTWNTCDISLLIDADGDGLAEQELLGAPMSRIGGLTSAEFASTLLDATSARQMRKDFETEYPKVKNDPKLLEALNKKTNYANTIIDQRGMTLYKNSSVVVIEAAVSQLARTASGNLALKLVASLSGMSTVQSEDFLAKTEKTNLQISLKKEDQSFIDLPETLTMNSVQTSLKLDLTKGAGHEDLLVLMPQNGFSNSDLMRDTQSQVLKARFVP